MYMIIETIELIVALVAAIIITSLFYLMYRFGQAMGNMKYE